MQSLANLKMNTHFTYCTLNCCDALIFNSFRQRSVVYLLAMKISRLIVSDRILI